MESPSSTDNMESPSSEAIVERRRHRRRKSLAKRKRRSLRLQLDGLDFQEQNPLPQVNNSSVQVDGELLPNISEQLPKVLAFLTERELMLVSLVCQTWADAVTTAHVNLMLASVGYSKDDNDGKYDVAHVSAMSREISMEQSWEYLHSEFPWACFLAEGAFKRVYKVHNSSTSQEEALSVMYVA